MQACERGSQDFLYDTLIGYSTEAWIHEWIRKKRGDGERGIEQSVWERHYDPHKLTPKLSPKLLAAVLRDVGADRSGQSIVFRELARNGRQFVYDLSVVFTRSEGITGLPTMIRALPGSVKDITTLTASISEVDIEGKILILDRGFFSEDVVAFPASTGNNLYPSCEEEQRAL